jgi:hypothetical protein
MNGGESLDIMRLEFVRTQRIFDRTGARRALISFIQHATATNSAMYRLVQTTKVPRLHTLSDGVIAGSLRTQVRVNFT